MYPDTATFDADVIEASSRAARRGGFLGALVRPLPPARPAAGAPGREAEGAWTLAKINVDREPQPGQPLRRAGHPRGERLPRRRRRGRVRRRAARTAVRRFLDAPAALARPIVAAAEGRRLAERGRNGRRRSRLPRRAGRTARPRRARCWAWGACWPGWTDRTRPQQALEALLPRTPEAREAAPLLARLRLAASRPSTDTRRRGRRALEARPARPRRQSGRGAGTRRAGAYAEALPHLLAVVERDKSYQDGAARSAMLAIFEALGADHPLTLEYRRKLASALYV